MKEGGMAWWPKYQGSNRFLPQKWECKGLRRDLFRNIFSPFFVQDSRSMSLLAEMGNFLPKLLCRSQRTLSWAMPILRIMWVLDPLLDSFLFYSGPAEASGSALQRHAFRSDHKPAQSFLLLSADVCFLWTHGSSGKAVLVYEAYVPKSQLHDLHCGRRSDESFKTNCAMDFKNPMCIL